MCFLFSSFFLVKPNHNTNFKLNNWLWVKKTPRNRRFGLIFTFCTQVFGGFAGNFGPHQLLGLAEPWLSSQRIADASLHFGKLVVVALVPPSRRSGGPQSSFLKDLSTKEVTYLQASRLMFGLGFTRLSINVFFCYFFKVLKWFIQKQW